MRILRFSVMSILNYLIIIVAILGYRLSGGVLLLYLLFQAGLSFANAFVSERSYQFVILSSHLLISTFIASPLGLLLHYYNDGDLSETLLLIPYITAISCVAAVGFSVLAFFVNKKRWMTDDNSVKHSSKSIWLVSGAVWGIVIFVSMTFVMPKDLQIINTQNVYIVYSYDNIEINEPLSQDDASKIAELYDGESLSLYTESCAFQDNIAVCFGDQKLRLATDGSGTIQYHGKFIDLEADKRLRLRNILSQYGAKFPCLKYRTLF